jgi:hypothetical protein
VCAIKGKERNRKTRNKENREIGKEASGRTGKEVSRRTGKEGGKMKDIVDRQGEGEQKTQKIVGM